MALHWLKGDVRDQTIALTVLACSGDNAAGRKTHREEELLDLLHGVRHAQVGVGDGRKHLDEHVQLHREVGVFGFSAFPQTLLLRKRQRHRQELLFRRTRRGRDSLYSLIK